MSEPLRPGDTAAAPSATADNEVRTLSHFRFAAGKKALDFFIAFLIFVAACAADLAGAKSMVGKYACWSFECHQKLVVPINRTWSVGLMSVPNFTALGPEKYFSHHFL